jgi:hypothetical protein
MNSEEYQGVLTDKLLPFIHCHWWKLLTFQQDNASVHVSRSTKAWLNEKHVTLLEWPSCSPDCNPMENMWGTLARRVYAHNRQFNSVNELKVAILEKWGNIEGTLISNLIGSMPNRVFQVIHRNCGLTSY